MRLSIWVAIPLYTLSVSALAIPSTTEDSHSVTVAGSIVSTNTTLANASLEAEYLKLESLKIQLYDLHHKVSQQEHHILKLIKHDFKTCSGVKCYLQTALRKAPDFFELLKTHFRHHPVNATTGSFDCPWKTKPADLLAEPDVSIIELVQEHPPLPLPSEKGDDELFQHGNEHPPPPPGPESDERPAFDGDHGGPTRRPFAPFEDGPDHRPPFGPPPGWHPNHGSPPEHKPWKQNPSPPAPHPEKPHHHGRPHHMPHPAPRHRHFRLILAMAGLVVTVLIFGLLFKALRVYLANPRVRADRAAHIEECRTRREYRRAACQHRFRQMIARFGKGRRSKSSNLADYEEKRAMLQQCDDQTQMDDHIVAADINSLRRAHEIVGQLMRAEEGRVRGTMPDMDEASGSRSVGSMTTTLPPYAPPPPRYSQELSRDMEVVDGFRYTPSNSEATVTSSASSFILDDDLTESSVVDCRSRMSMDTESAPQSKKSLELAGDRYRGQFD